MSDPVTLPPQISRVLRRLRIAYRADPEVYPVLLALEELALAYERSCGDETMIAMPDSAGNDHRVTILQAARRAGVSAQAICKAIHEGRLEADRFSTVWQVSERSLTRYMAARERQERQERKAG